MKLVLAYADGKASMAELCRRHGVSRKTGHKWWRRYVVLGVANLKDRTSRPRTSPRKTCEMVESAIVKLRQMHPTWGPKKLRVLLGAQSSKFEAPAISTIGEVLNRNGLILRRRRSRRSLPSSNPLSEYGRPNAVWCADFKGDILLDGRRCRPLTIVDGYSRFLIACKAMYRTRARDVRKVFFEAFKTYGVPDTIRTDNGPPFASKGAGGLTALSVWWIKLGIRPERIQPGHPEQNGRQERFHRTLKRETAAPPAKSLIAQQRRFNRFQPIYNELRPHESLAQTPPASFYQPSSRCLPDRWLDPTYPDSHEVHRTTRVGAINWRGYHLQLNQCLDRELVSVVRTRGKQFEVFFAHVLLGHFRQPRRNTKSIRLITTPSAQRGGDGS